MNKINSIFISILLFFSANSLSFAQETQEIIVQSLPIERFKGVLRGEKVDELIWRGGIEVSSDYQEFGGLSGITFTGDNYKIVMVSDIGNFFSAQLIYDEFDQLLALGGVEMSAITNSKGNVLPRRFAQDAEAIDTIYRFGKVASIRVGFENLTRVADFELNNGKPFGAAKEVAIPHDLSKERTNASLEALCIAPKNSPIADSTLLITENMLVGENIAGFMLGNKDRGRFSIKKTKSMNPTDCAFLENGDLLILERGISFLSFSMQLRLIKAEKVQPKALLEGEVILSARGSKNIDNMEGLAVYKDANDKERIIIISDDNFNDWERTLFLEFSFE